MSAQIHSVNEATQTNKTKSLINMWKQSTSQTPSPNATPSEWIFIYACVMRLRAVTALMCAWVSQDRLSFIHHAHHSQLPSHAPMTQAHKYC